MEEIQKELEENFKKNPNDFNAFKDLILFYLKEINVKYWNKALEIFSQKSNLFTNIPEYYSLLSGYYTRVKYREAKSLAIEALQKAMNLDDKNPRWYVQMGFVYWHFDEIENAIRWTKSALDLAGSFPDYGEKQVSLIKNNLAFYYACVGRNKEQAIEYAEEAYRILPNAPRADTLGYVYMKFAESMDDLVRAKNLLENVRNMEGAIPEEVDKHLAEWEKRRGEMEKSKGVQ